MNIPGKKILITLALACILVVAAVLLVFKGNRIKELLVPVPGIETSTLKTDELQTVTVYHPADTPEGLVMIATGTGQDKESDLLARELAAENLIAVTFDFAAVRKELASAPADDECHYMSDDLKDAGEAILRHLQLKQYFFPVIVGNGDAAMFAYAALAQAPKNTLAGAVSIGFSKQFRTDRPYCPGAEMKPVSDQASPAEREYLLGNNEPLPSPWVVISSASGQAEIDSFQNPLDEANSVVAETAKDQRRAAIAAIHEMERSGEAGIQSLPVSVIRPEGDAKALIIIISGDGGWRDIDKSIGENLATKGIAVIGVDSLRYFWARKEPAKIAADLQLLLTEYGKEFHTDNFALAGYSFGANVIPFAWPLLDKPVRKKVKVISLLGLSPDTEFEISVEGYLGSSTGASEDVRPLLARLPANKTQCFYGEEEVEDGETACTSPELDQAERIKTAGGHHFDGNYDALADSIAARILAP